MGMMKNSSIILGGVIIANAIAYLFHVYVARVLGPVEYGVFGALFSLFLIISLPAGAISSAIAKFTAIFNSRKEYEKINTLRRKLQKVVFFSAVAIFLLIVLLSESIADYMQLNSRIPVIVVGVCFVFTLILPVNRGILQGMKKFKEYSLNCVLESASRFVLVVALLSLGFRVNGSLLAYGLAYLIAFLGVFPHIKGRIKIKKPEEKLKMNKVYKFILLVLFVNLLMQVIINLPTIFIKHYFSSEFTGYWTASLTLARAMLFIAGGISLVMFPEIAGKKKRKEQREVFKKALILTLVVSIGIAFLFLAIPEFFIYIIYGYDFMPASAILSFMGIAMIFVSVLQLWINYWLARKG